MFHWRDCEEWKKGGLPLSTSSNEAAKLYDVAVNQYVGFYESEDFGGFEGTFTSLRQADPEFVMGHVLSNALHLISMSSNCESDSGLQQRLKDMTSLANKQCITEREQLHVRAVEQLSCGFLVEACRKWEEILLEHPHDMLALRLVQDGYFHLGKPAQIRDCIARLLPEWKTSMSDYGFLLGMYSFGLCETGSYELAEKMAQKALEINCKDHWSVHAMAHVLEMTGRVDEGINFLQSTSDNWQHQSLLSCHLNWHSALYHIENGGYDIALDIFDDKILSSMNKRNTAFNVSDGSSLLYRLSLEGCNVENRWQDLSASSLSHLHDHASVFYDVHYLLSFLGAQQEQPLIQFLESTNNFTRYGRNSNHRIMCQFGQPLFEALMAYDKGNFEITVEKLLPVRYDLMDAIGGSKAQKDIIMQTLIRAAMKSPNPQHRILSRRLLAERKAFKETSPLTDRLVRLSTTIIE